MPLSLRYIILMFEWEYGVQHLVSFEWRIILLHLKSGLNSNVMSTSVSHTIWDISPGKIESNVRLVIIHAVVLFIFYFISVYFILAVSLIVSTHISCWHSCSMQIRAFFFFFICQNIFFNLLSVILTWHTWSFFATTLCFTFTQWNTTCSNLGACPVLSQWAAPLWQMSVKATPLASIKASKSSDHMCMLMRGLKWSNTIRSVRLLCVCAHERVRVCAH